MQFAACQMVLFITGKVFGLNVGSHEPSVNCTHIFAGKQHCAVGRLVCETHTGVLSCVALLA